MGEGRALGATSEQLRTLNLLALVGGLSPFGVHDARNLVALVSGNLEYLERQLSLSGTAAEAMQDARDGASRLLELLKTLRSLTHQDDGARGLISVDDVLVRALPSARVLLKKQVDFVEHIAPCPRLRGDAVQIAQALLNLLYNAWTATSLTEDYPKVTLRVAPLGDTVHFSVIDNGVGLSGDVERLFVPYRSEWPEPAGGLGLPVARAIAQRHGGQLSASPTADGALFTLSLPAMEPGSGRGRVLLIDDDERVLGALERLLRKRHDVVTRTSGNAAIACLEDDTDFHIIISDLMMADGSGQDLYRWLKASCPALLSRLVFISGGAYGVDFEGFLNRVAVPFVEKPLEPDELRELVERYVAKYLTS